jgi:quinohemoprotein ethanol dehydrogenase
MLAAILVAGCGRGPAPPADTPAAPAGNVTAARLAAADAEPGEWFTTGRDAAGSYYSPLADIHAGNVDQLGFAWEYGLGTRRGLEATPIVVDGTMYFPGNFGRVYALDAASGAQKWVYDPEVDGQRARFACCDAVNRGVAVWQGRVYVGALDGYLHALDAATGKRLFKVDTLPERGPGHPYVQTGAVVIAGDNVIVGSSGADFAGVRGYVAAYDRTSGAFRWRFYTVPRDPKLGPQDQPHLEKAVETWDRRHRWDEGSGAAVWDGISYDAELGLVYVGTGNGAPYNIREGGRSGGDDLFAASIVAIRASSGALAWYFQTTPGDRWDYDSAAKMILAELDLGHGPRKVLMQASKNGFFYVLDRASGEVLAAHQYTYVNWTRGLDPRTHRPLPNPAADYERGPKLVFPGMSGAHNWQPMSLSASTGLVYIPALEAPMVYVDTAARPAGLIEGTFTTPGFMPEGYDPKPLASLFGPLPSLATLSRGIPAAARSRGVIRALDPRTGKIVWDQPTASAWDGGLLSTAGNLVLEGDVTGHLTAYAADSGRQLARIDLATSVMAAPITYRVKGTQYVAVLAGYGGGMMGGPFPTDSAAYRYGNAGRLIALRLGGGAVPKPASVSDAPFVAPASRPDARLAAKGEILYNRYCARCHVFDRSVLPDLRRMTAATDALFYEIVLNGAYVAKGMGRWDDVLSHADAEAIHAFVLDRTWSAYEAEQPAASRH